MKYNFTLKRLLFSCMAVLGLLFSQKGIGQVPTNQALTNATFWHPTNVNYGQPGSGYGPELYNDDAVPTYGVSAADSFTFAATGGAVKVTWGFQNAIDSINKIVIYKNDRPVTNFDLMLFDQSTLALQNVYTYNSTNTPIADSIIFPPGQAIAISDIIGITPPIPPATTRDTVIFANLQGFGANPSFREIQLWTLPACNGSPNATITARLLNGPIEAGANPLPGTINACFGYNVYFNAESNTTSSGHAYQWQINKSGTWVNVPGTGSGNAGFIFKALYDVQVRVIDTCVYSGQFATSNVISVSVDQTGQYQSIPYYMGFDNPWVSSPCLSAPYTNDLPAAAGWTNDPPFLFNSWRQDAGVTPANSGWVSPNNGSYSGAGPRLPYGVAVPAADQRSARIHTSNMPGGLEGNLDLYLDASTPAGDKALYFYYINQGVNNSDSLRVLMSLDEGDTWTRLAGFDSAQLFKKRLIPIQSNNAKTIIRFQGFRKPGTDGSDIGLDSVYVAGPCSGTPTVGKLKPGGTISVCAGTPVNLTTLGTTMAGGLVYTWEESVNGGSFSPVNGGIGSDNLFFTTPPVYDTIQYRLKLQCGTSGTAVYSDTITINTAERTYAQLPYTQGFETWVNKCSTGDMPASAGGGSHWANYPDKANNSWRIDNTTAAAAGWLNVGAAYSPTGAPFTFPGNNRSARFHSSGSFFTQYGNMDLLFNGSGSTGTKEVSFFYLNTSGTDSLKLFYSTDGGRNFALLNSYGNVPSWKQYRLQVPCNTANCVIRFQGWGDYQNTSDIGLDSVTVLPPCTGTPAAGTLTTANPCANTNFTLDLQGTTFTGGLTYTWEKSMDSLNWTPFGNNLPYMTDNISVNTYYRVRVKCNNSGQEDVSPVRLIIVKEFYYCYCESAAEKPVGPDIGNVTVKRMPGGGVSLNNGNATPMNNNSTATKTYTDFRYSIPPVPMYQDSSYSITVSQINSGSFTPPGTTVATYIDFNRDGIFDTSERVMLKNSVNNSFPQQQVEQTFVMPDTAQVGITGMRVIMRQGIHPDVPTCGVDTLGETEDYLIEIRYPPCKGPTNAGTAHVSDTSSCIGYPITLVDTSHEHKRFGVTWLWEYSPDGFSWATLANSVERDTMQYVITGQTYFRLRMLCLSTLDTTFSNVVSVSVNPSYSCYCFSMADGGTKDTSDIGGFSLANIVIPANGPHLLNPNAVSGRTDYTSKDTIHLKIDSTYQMIVYHTQKSGYHGNAKITLFMDLNNDLSYNVGGAYNERIWTGYSSATNFTIIDSITIPAYAIPNTLTGMRLILNNDTGPNAPSDSACGTYTSGETEDFVVMFHVPWSVNVSDPANISQLHVYPNPTEGLFNVRYQAQKPVEDLTITVTSLTGQKMVQHHYKKPGREFARDLDISGVAKGVYLVEIKADNERQIRKLIVK